MAEENHNDNSNDEELEHRRSPTAHSHRRKADKSAIARLNEWFSLRGFVIWLATGIIGLAGIAAAQYRLPARMSKVEADVDSAQKDIKTVKQSIMSFAKLQCFNPSYTAEQLYAVEIDCTPLWRALSERQRSGQNGTAPGLPAPLSLPSPIP